MIEHISAGTLRRQAIFWLLALAALVVFLLVFRSILLPFLAGFALAYILDPIADYFESKGMSRVWATITILFVFVIVFIVALAVLVPVLATQAVDFAARVPSYIAGLRETITNMDFNSSWIENKFGFDLPGIDLGLNSGELVKQFDQYLQESFSVVGTVLNGLWNSGQAVMNIIGLLVVTPVVAFYMLLDWDKMVAKIDGWVPREHVKTVRGLGDDINGAIAGFVRGQGTVCLILSIFYAVGLTLAGLNFGLLIGLLTGMLSFIPYVGSAIGLVLSVGIALFQFWPDYFQIGVVVAIFITGQFMEGNFLQPKLVGSSVGLHPVWLMFALFAFGALFGFIGMLIAVPAAATVGVFVRFALLRYLESDLYLGDKVAVQPQDPPAEDA